METLTFPIEPAATRTFWLLALLAAGILAILVLVLGAALLGARGARFEVSSDGLRLRGDLYGRLVPAAQLRPQEARRIDLATDNDLAPRVRTRGTGLPGYSAGWFRLRNGERSLVYLTDRSHAVYVPTDAGYSVLVSPSDPDGFVAALRRLAR